MSFLRTTMLLVLASIATLAAAEDYFVGDMHVMLPWARATPPTANTGAGYMAVMNHGTAAERLLGASAEVSERVELHDHIRDGDMMRMIHVDAIDIPPGETVAFEPGGLHIMFIGLHAPLEEGAEFPVTLEFEQAGAVELMVPVRGIDGGRHGHGHGHSHSH